MILYLIVIIVQFFFFFFQAEDGIRDLIVTGVQTCALPIFLDRRKAGRKISLRDRIVRVVEQRERDTPYRHGAAWVGLQGLFEYLLRGVVPEIGRASCRERV